MQLLCEKTEEGNTDGLNIIPAKVKRFSNQVKVPQMGWNIVKHNSKGIFTGISQNCFMYLVHSYYVPLNNSTIAECNYCAEYSVAFQKNNFYGVQFHPEKSSKNGQLLLENFLNL